MDIEDILNISERKERFEEILVDTYDEYEALSAFEVYLNDGLVTPFSATIGLPDSPDARPVTVLAVASTIETEGILLRVRHQGGNEEEVPAVQIWSSDAVGRNALILSDFRAFVDQGGLPGSYEDDEE